MRTADGNGNETRNQKTTHSEAVKVYRASTLPFTFNTTVEEIASGAAAGNVRVTPSAPFFASNFFPSASNVADSTGALTPGTTSFPSPGQLNTCRYSFV